MAHNDIEVLCDFYDSIINTMEDVNKKLKAGDGMIRPSDAEYVERLSKAAQNAATTMAMIEHSEMDEYSQDRGSYLSRDDRSMMDGGTSRTRGRRNAPRDSMGRYSGDYSREYQDEARSMSDNIRSRMRSRDMQNDM